MQDNLLTEKNVRLLSARFLLWKPSSSAASEAQMSMRFCSVRLLEIEIEIFNLFVKYFT